MCTCKTLVRTTMCTANSSSSREQKATVCNAAATGAWWLKTAEVPHTKLGLVVYGAETSSLSVYSLPADAAEVRFFFARRPEIPKAVARYHSRHWDKRTPFGTFGRYKRTPFGTNGPLIRYSGDRQFL
jgi:hypothetical protein